MIAVSGHCLTLFYPLLESCVLTANLFTFQIQSDGGDSPAAAAADALMGDNISIATSIDTTSGASMYSVSADPHDLARKYKHHIPDNDRPMYRKDILYSGSVQQLPQYNRNISKSDIESMIKLVT